MTIYLKTLKIIKQTNISNCTVRVMVKILSHPGEVIWKLKLEVLL